MQHLSELEVFVEKASCLFVQHAGIKNAAAEEVAQAIGIYCIYDDGFWSVDLKQIEKYLKGEAK